MDAPGRNRTFGELIANGDFEKDLAALINRYSVDACVGVHDFILAEYITDQIEALDNCGREYRRVTSTDTTRGNE